MADVRDPIADLRRIAFLLEQANEATYRVRAFRTAAATLADLPVAEVRRRAAAGTLTELPGVGTATAQVVTQSVAGSEPEYLADLRSRRHDPIAEAGTAGDGEPGAATDAATGTDAATDADTDTDTGTGTGGAAVNNATRQAARTVRAALRGDCHSHSDWSDGGSPIEEMALAAVELGHGYLVITDHSPRLTIARGLPAERLRRQLDRIDEINSGLPAGFRLLTGIEVDILPDGSLDQEDELLARLDVVVASLHSRLRDPEQAVTARMLTAVANPHVDILGHCTGRRLAPALGTARRGDRAHRRAMARPESTFDSAAVFTACAAHGTAVEINCRPDRLDPPLRLLRQAVEAGCWFAIDTDAHAPGQLAWQDAGCLRAAECGVPVERVVNTLPAAALLSWTRARD